ncbi:ubiquinol-cytochrome C reductase complex subunit oxen [Lasioglossum baleicum]|uniref:ubiquinol-cytochrome C reductase complex subunit oxen n=1 Tax=Lasioglossum baleicum TaxID=434251 RepID=UPI003FCD40D0
MAGIYDTLYTVIFKRSSTFTMAIIAGSFFFERSVDLFSDNLFKSINKGKLWDDIKHNYEQ